MIQKQQHKLQPKENAKLLEKLKSCFKRTVNWNKYRSEPKLQAQNHLIDPTFQRLNRLFVLSFEKRATE